MPATACSTVAKASNLNRLLCPILNNCNPNAAPFPDEHALQASPLQRVGRRLKQQQMLGEPEPIMKWLVAKHNELRARHGVPPMVWDWGLAWNAYNYVLNCPNGHSGQPGIGENLACEQQQQQQQG